MKNPRFRHLGGVLVGVFLGCLLYVGRHKIMASDIVVQTDRLHMAIGRMVVEFQFVENIVAECLASLLRMREHEDQHRVAAAMSYRQKVDLLCVCTPDERTYSGQMSRST